MRKRGMKCSKQLRPRSLIANLTTIAFIGRTATILTCPKGEGATAIIRCGRKTKKPPTAPRRGQFWRLGNLGGLLCPARDSRRSCPRVRATLRQSDISAAAILFKPIRRFVRDPVSCSGLCLESVDLNLFPSHAHTKPDQLLTRRARISIRGYACAYSHCASTAPAIPERIFDPENRTA